MSINIYIEEKALNILFIEVRSDYFVFFKSAVTHLLMVDVIHDARYHRIPTVMNTPSTQSDGLTPSQ